MRAILFAAVIAAYAVLTGAAVVSAGPINGAAISDLAAALDTRAEPAQYRRRCPPGHKRDRRGRCYWPYE